MDVTRMLQELRSEREAVEQAIMTIERLALGRGRRRGRPPAWMSAVQTGQAAAPAKRRGRPAGSKNKKVEGKSSE
jgi:hypothetical protein